MPTELALPLKVGRGKGWGPGIPTMGESVRRNMGRRKGAQRDRSLEGGGRGRENQRRGAAKRSRGRGRTPKDRRADQVGLVRDPGHKWKICGIYGGLRV